MARRKSPRGFDPHPGDPWHPDWSPDEEAAAPEVPEGEEPWWRRALGRKTASGESVDVPTVYAALEDAEANSPAAGESQLVADAIAAAESELAGRADLADESEFVVEVVLPDEEVVPAKPLAALDPTPVPLLVAEEPAAQETVVQETVVVDLLAAEAVSEIAAADEPAEDEPASVELVAEEPTPQELAAQEAELEESATRHAVDLADRLTVDSGLELAQSLAHEDARMWVAVGLARAEGDALDGAADRIAKREAERQEAIDAWAAEALAIEESRRSMEESRKRTEELVRDALNQDFGTQHVPAHMPVSQPADAADINARFAAIAAELADSAASEDNRLERREELRLRTSLLVLDAEQPWDVDGWSRPGASFNPRGAGSGANRPIGHKPTRSNPRGPSAQLLIRARGSIDTGSAPVVQESQDRRRWPWSRKTGSPATPDGMRRPPQSVVVIEERSVSDREHEMGEDGQSALPLDDATSSVLSPNGSDIEDDLEAWSDLDWDIDDSPNDADPLERGATIVFGDPDAEDSGSADSADDDDWEVFTSEEYVKTSTHDYADLAAAVAAAEAEAAPEQAAISADMPGLESSLVGLEDVVAAEGMEAATEAPRSDLAIRVVTALALVSLFFASLSYHWSIALLVLVVMALAAFEITTALINNDHHPVGLFIYLGTIGVLLGTWAYGPVAIPVAVAATLLVTVLFFGLVTGRQEPLVAMALTILVVLWVGVFSSFAMDIVNADEFRWLIGSFVIIVAAMDIAQYFVGKRFGKRQLAPVVSPKKTIAGLVGGMVTAVGLGYAFSFVAPFEGATGLLLGGALAVSGPVGDLAVSVLKRALDEKDMGTILPGHGGVVDRIDAILFSIPAAWIVYSWAGLLV